MSLINCKVYLELSWIEGYILTSDGDSSKFEITVAKLHVPMFTTKGNIIVTKQLSDGFKDQLLEQLSNKACKGSRRRKKHELLNVSFQGVRRLFVLAYVIVAGAANDSISLESVFFGEGRLVIITH